MFEPQPPKYTCEVCFVGNHPVLCIVDRFSEESPSMTVTNGAQLVLSEIARNLGQLPRTIIYRDSEGEWDRLQAEADGTFLGFAPVAINLSERVRDQRQAMELAVLSNTRDHGQPTQ